VDTVRIDPASSQRTGIGPAAYNAYERVFTSRKLAKAPGGKVVDMLDFIACLLEKQLLRIHPRCKHLIQSFREYKRAEIRGEFQNYPEENQVGIEDPMDALRYGIKSIFPAGFEAPSNLVYRPIGSILH
jgi:hypothetical protein